MRAYKGVRLRRIVYSLTLFRNLTEVKNSLKEESKKVKVVYKHLNTSLKFLFKTLFFQGWFAGVSTGGIP